MATCKATTGDGTQCQREARDGRYCWQHQCNKSDSSAGAYKLDDIRRRKILAALEQGASYQIAADKAGIARSTLHRWRNDFEDFEADCKKAEARGATKLLENIQTAADKDWRAAAWLLEKRYPDIYGDNAGETASADAEIDSEAAPEPAVDWSEVSDSEAEEIIDVMEQLGA